MHRNAPLTPEGRFRLCLLIEDGWTVAAAAESMRISRQTAHKWWRRYQEAGRSRPGGPLEPAPALPDQDTGQHGAPARRAATTPPARSGPSGPEGRGARLDAAPGPPAPWGVAALRPRAPQGGRVIRRIETTRPGELVHVDIKKQAKIPKGGGWRVKGSGQAEKRQDRSTPPRLRLRPLGHRRPLPPGLLRDPRRRAGHHGYRVLAAGPGVLRQLRHHRRAGALRQRLLLPGQGLHRRARRRRHHTPDQALPPQTNGKVERFNRTLQNEWAYARPYRSEAARTRALDTWLHMYNHHRHHTAIGGPPTSRVSNLVGQNT